jgi:hypothetical protein
MYAADQAIYRVLFSMGQLNPESIGWALEKMKKERTGGMAHLAQRLWEDGVLRNGISVAHATDVLWVLCSFETFDALTAVRGLEVEEAINTMVQTAESALCERQRPDPLPQQNPGGHQRVISAGSDSCTEKIRTSSQPRTPRWPTAPRNPTHPTHPTQLTQSMQPMQPTHPVQFTQAKQATLPAN